MIIIFTGTPGTGKTKLAKALSKELNYKYIDVNQIIDENKLKEEYDEKRDTYIIDEGKLSNALIKLIKEEKNLIIDSHMAHEVPSVHVDYCIVTICNPPKLKERLEARGYSEEKVQENIDSELFQVCLNEALEEGHHVYPLDTTDKSIEECVEEIKDEINQNQ
jgi:adenylate kinase